MAQYHTQTLQALFGQEKVLTLDAMKQALGTKAKMTVFRKLRALSYRASYSHAGKYYTLDEIAEYDQHGLWNYRRIYFSKHGSLLNTIEALVCASKSGYFAHELQELLQVRVHAPLLKLTTSGHLFRESLAQGYLYLCPRTWKSQLNRQKQMLKAAASGDQPPAAIQQALGTFLATLNEKQRRLYAGFESMKLGRGGDVLISQQIGLNVKTIARGRRELASQKITVDRVRQVGGGAKALEKKVLFSKS
ncbi:MAG: hypothetical protein ACREOO_14030 [bacterium]